MCVSLYTSFTHHNPSGRVILDAVSSLTTALIKSLKLGCCRVCKFSLSFRRDLFNFLFNNCGSSVCRRPGKLFYRSDLILCIFLIVILFFLMTLKKVFVLISCLYV